MSSSSNGERTNETAAAASGGSADEAHTSPPWRGSGLANCASTAVSETLSTKVLHDNPYWSYRKDVYQLSGGQPHDYYYVQTNPSALVIPVIAWGTPAAQVVMVRQFRYLEDRWGLEFPGGQVGDPPSVQAALELEEEAGFKASDLKLLGVINPCKGLLRERCHVFVARGLTPVQQRLEATELLTVERIRPADVWSHIADGSLWDGQSIAAWALFEAHNRRSDD